MHIGPYCVVGENVELCEGARLESHVCVSGWTTIGSHSRIGAFATVGAIPQDFKYAGEPSVLVIGERCRIAEYAHLSGGTAAGGGVTSLGDECFIMSHCHVAHDCVLGDRVLLASSAALAGHVHVGNDARISGCACVHQRVRIGRGAFLGGGAVLAHDLIPYGLAHGNRASLRSLNLVGLRRDASVTPAELRALLAAFRYLFDLPRGEGPFSAPAGLPSLPTVRARAQLLAELEETVEGEDGVPRKREAGAAGSPLRPRFERVLEMATFVLGRRRQRSQLEHGSLPAGGEMDDGALCVPAPEQYDRPARPLANAPAAGS